MNRNHYYITFALILCLGLTITIRPLVFAQQEDPQIIAGSTIYYVSPTGNNSNGLNWTDAYNNIWDAISAAHSGDEIWVASGRYTPGNNVNISFNLKSGVAMYGGFSGTETARTQRDWAANSTILSGDLGGDDANTNGIVTSPDGIVGLNSLHVVTAQAVTANTVLDGFIITAGSATEGSGSNQYGGGFYCAGSGDGNQCHPTLTNLIFSGNKAGSGGALYTDSVFDGHSSPTLTNIIFTGNQAGSGGAIYISGQLLGDSNPTLTNIVFIGNSAGSGGAMHISGTNGNSEPILTNVTFYNNTATRGGAIENFGADVSVTNTIFWGNSATSSGAAIRNNDSHITLTTSLIQGGVTGSDIYNDADSMVTDVEGNIADDPLFVDAANGNLRLQANSPAIDTGINPLTSYPTDLDGNPRIIHVRTDMGAYETPFYTLSVAVTGSGSGVVNGMAIACGGDCMESYARGAEVVLTAVPDSDFIFTGWSGSGCSGIGSCVVTMTADTAVTATFSEGYLVYLPVVIKP